jgi:hypothetical protein
MSIAVVESLGEQCVAHIILHLEEYPNSYLALLPLWLRKKILWKLPMADVCKLEESEFVSGISMGEYWSSTFDEYCLARPDGNLRGTKYFEGHWKKAVVHGNLFAQALGFCSHEETDFFVDHDDSVVEMSLSLMFGIREEKKSKQKDRSEVWVSSNSIPPRYHDDYRLCTSKENLVVTMIECFRGDLPLYLHIAMLEEAECDYLFGYVPFLKNLRYLQLKSQKFGPKLQKLAIQIIQEAANLEVLIINFSPPDFDEPPIPLQSLDRVISELTKTSFPSNMHMFIAFCWAYEVEDDDMERGFFTVSHDVLKEFIDAFLSAPAHHDQRIRLEGTVVACDTPQELCGLLGVKCPPKKDIEFIGCKFGIDYFNL